MDYSQEELELKKEIKRLQNVVADQTHQLVCGYNYLMETPKTKITAPDALEAFGFGRDGLKQIQES